MLLPRCHIRQTIVDVMYLTQNRAVIYEETVQERENSPVGLYRLVVIFPNGNRLDYEFHDRRRRVFQHD